MKILVCGVFCAYVYGTQMTVWVCAHMRTPWEARTELEVPSSIAQISRWTGTFGKAGCPGNSWGSVWAPVLELKGLYSHAQPEMFILKYWWFWGYGLSLKSKDREMSSNVNYNSC